MSNERQNQPPAIRPMQILVGIVVGTISRIIANIVSRFM
jgi:hypothetical protein